MPATGSPAPAAPLKPHAVVAKPEQPVGQAEKPVARKEAEKPAPKRVDAPVQEAPKSVEDNGNVTLEQVTKAWKQIRVFIKPQSLSLDGLLNSCRLLEVKNSTLVIGFASEVLRKKADTPEQTEITRKAILEVCGGQLSIKWVVTNAKQAVPPDVKSDGMVAAALKHGGEIVDTQE